MRGKESVKIKYKDLLASWIVIEKIMKSETPFKLQYWLNKNIISIGKTISNLERERISLFNKYKTETENKEFKEKMNEILDKEIEIYINLIEIKLFENVNLTSLETKLIQYMVCEDRIIKVLHS